MQPMPVPVSRRSLVTAILQIASTLLRIVILFLVCFGTVSEPKAQGGFFWAEQERIPEFFDATEEPPYMIADSNHTIHAFNAQPLERTDLEGPKAIFYRQWTIENGWTFPNDILYDADGLGYSLVGVTNDSSGRVHLLLQKFGSLYYVQNYLALAENAASWPTPVFVAANTQGAGPGYEFVSAIASDASGEEIIVIFSGHEYGSGLYFASSANSGLTWTEPYPIYLTGDELILVTDPKLYVGESGLVHAVWSTFLDSGAGGPGHYANFNMETQAWSEPIELDLPGIRTPSVIEVNGEVFVSYHHLNVNGNWWRKSTDGGKTWSFPEQFSSRHIGTNGNVSFVVDSANVLHAFFGERIDDRNHGVWHLTYTGSTWAGIEAVVRGPQRRDRTGGDGYDPRSARAIIVNGNLVLVAWGTDGFAGTNGAWYSYKRLDAPELPTVPLESPTLIPQITPTVEVSPTADVIATSTVDLSALGGGAPQFAQNPQTALILGVVPALLLLGGLVVLYYIVQNRTK